jgi:glycosyltransferase involved in cell wall biosynthesis
MKICIAEDIKRLDSGKHKFLNRLSKEIVNMGCQIVDDNADILLHIGRNIKGKSAKKIIMRVDGLILNLAQPYEKNNRKILKYINRSDAVIYQGDFCRDAYEKFLGVKKKNICIHNGADPSEFLKRDVTNYFFTYCRWRPHKRHRNICKGFINAIEKGLDSVLYIGGEVDQKERIDHPKINYLGWMPPDEIKACLGHAIATIHLSWLDWCPNSMVESIMAGCPIVYSDSGGSKEIGKFGGIPIHDTQWDFTPTLLYEPPWINGNTIADALIEMKGKKFDVDREALSINNIAKKYVSFFREVLCQ